MPRVTPESAEAVRKRQAARAARELAAGRVRRGYYATPTEHTALAEHLSLLRGSVRLGEISVADASDVLEEFKAI